MTERFSFHPILPDDYFSSHMYYYLWNKWMKDKSLARVLWWYMPGRDYPLSLDTFIRLFSHYSGRYMYVGLDTEADGAVSGTMWIESIQLPHSINVGLWLDFGYRGSAKSTYEDVLPHAMLKHLETLYKPRHIFVYTPWNDARALAERLGFQPQAAIVHGCQSSPTGAVHVFRKDY